VPARFSKRGTSVARDAVGRPLVSVSTRVGLVLTVPIFVVCGLYRSQIRPHQHTATYVSASAAAITRSEPADERFLPNANADRCEKDVPVDLFGNEVMPAVASYGMDATGSLYELHSPQTELPKLGSPKS